jgi:23S rRNA pseudouridine2605 synthase
MTDKRDTQNRAETPEENAANGERIAKVMARVGLCSRRDAERWIADGRVAVNGTVLDSPAFNVTESDRVSVDGRPIGPRERTRLFMFHKLRGTVTTDHDPEGRPTIFEDLPRDLPRVITIGRLDINTEGLLLLTNDGGLARMLELPATGWLRRYRVRAHGDVTQPQLDALAEGVTIEGVEYRGIEATLDRVQGANVWLTMGLREGKNREIKRVLEHLGLSVNRLIRLSFGPFQLGDLPEGSVEEVKTRVLMDQLGEKLAEEAGADFDAPIFADERGPRRQEGRRQETREEAPRGRPASNEIGAPQTPDRNYRDVAVAKRKHVSVLRSERDGSADEPRKVERSKTQDRRGRTVAVERVAPREAEAPVESRNARRFAQERSGEFAQERSGEEPRRERSESRGERPRNERGRSDRARADTDGKRAGERSGGERPPMRRRGGEGGSGFQRPEFQRAEGGFKTEGLSEKRSYGDRPQRSEGRSERPYGDRPSRPPFKRAEGGGDRPPRSEGRSERPYGDRPSRPPFKRPEGGGDRPPRSEGRSERPYSDRPSRPPFKRPEGGGDRPPRSEGRSERPYGDRPSRPPFKRPEGGADRPPRSEGRSEGRSEARPPRESRRGEARPTGGKPFRDSPGGGRSFGEKPAGKSFGGGGGFGTGGKPGGRKGGRPAGGKPGGGSRSFGGGGKPNAGRSGPGGRPAGSRSGGKPGGRTGGKPGGGRRGDS